MAHYAALLVDGAPDDELTVAATIEVHERLDCPARYAVSLPLAVADGDIPLLIDDRLAPDTQLTVVAESGGARECLVSGPVTGQRIDLVHGGAGSGVTVDGGDAAIAMGREDRAEVWSDVSDSTVVETIATRNALAPDAEPTATTHPEDGHSLVQRETDLALVRRLARRNGYTWWVTSAEDGTGTLHFRPAPTGEPGVGELAINLADHAVERLEITWDTERPTSAGAMQVDPRSKSVIDGTASASPLTPLGSTGFDAIATGTRAAWVPVVADDAADLQGRTGAVLAAGSFFARACGSTTTARARTILRSGTVVELRGAGTRHSGPWLCSGVRHVIDATTHEMHFELVRNGWGTG